MLESFEQQSDFWFDFDFWFYLNSFSFNQKWTNKTSISNF
jgi:hypothetical protein